MPLPGTLQPAAPYDFAATLGIARFHTVLDIVDDGVLWRALRSGDTLALLRVSVCDDGALAVDQAAADGAPDPTLLLDRARDWLAVDADLRPFYALAAADPALGPVVAPLVGLRHLRAADLYEALLTTIIEQQITLAGAQRAERWLIATYGDSISHEGRLFYTFPHPERLAALTVDDLKPLKITNRRMAVLLDLARGVANGALDLDAIAALPPAEAHRELVKLRGVGAWTAAWALIRATGHYHYMGAGDVALRAAVNHFFYGATGRATPEQTDAVLLRYGDHAGAAAFYTLMRWALLRY
jgi:DNA-3-methyladenine glycosylase II